MPPTPQPGTPSSDTSHMIPEHAAPKRRSGTGPIVGVFIIVLLLVVGALYFWGAELNRADAQPLPFIPGDSVNS